MLLDNISTNAVGVTRIVLGVLILLKERRNARESVMSTVRICVWTVRSVGVMRSLSFALQIILNS